LTLALDHQPVAAPELSAALSALAAEKGKMELLIEATGDQRWLDQTLQTLRAAALQAGVRRIQHREEGIPFGPGLAVGVVLMMLFWHVLGPQFQMLFFNPLLLLVFAVLGGTFMFISSGVLGVMRRARQ